MINRPSNVRIGFRHYAIQDLPAAGPLSANHALGACGFDEGIIQVDPTVDTEMQAQVLLHEIIHGIWRVAELPGKHEERIVSALTHNLAGFIQDNPLAVKWILDGLRSKQS